MEQQQRMIKNTLYTILTHFNIITDNDIHPPITLNYSLDQCSHLDIIVHLSHIVYHLLQQLEQHSAANDDKIQHIQSKLDKANAIIEQLNAQLTSSSALNNNLKLNQQIVARQLSEGSISRALIAESNLSIANDTIFNLKTDLDNVKSLLYTEQQNTACLKGKVSTLQSQYIALMSKLNECLDKESLLGCTITQLLADIDQLNLLLADARHTPDSPVSSSTTSLLLHNSQHIPCHAQPILASSVVYLSATTPFPNQAERSTIPLHPLLTNKHSIPKNNRSQFFRILANHYTRHTHWSCPNPILTLNYFSQLKSAVGRIHDSPIDVIDPLFQVD